MAAKIVVLGAGFGGLELSTILSNTLGDDLELTLIDKSDHFIFGYSKLDVMFGRQTPEAVRIAYQHIVKPGVRFRQEYIRAIDPLARRGRPMVGHTRPMLWWSRSVPTTISTPLLG